MRDLEAATSVGYRPDIDGLRAIAVIFVLLFHAELGPFTGGFVGVDVFFVISGFLITGLIVAEVEATRSFSFSAFYTRRARRILPALFFTIALSSVFAFLLFSPEHLKRFGGSMFSAVLSFSNVFFWQESGYFNIDAVNKPLLHTWSLGVEEQFYIFWPLLVIVLLKRSIAAAAIGIAATGVLSFWANGWVLGGEALPAIRAAFPWTKSWMREGVSAAFFLTPFRVFEFSIGALMVWLVRLQPDRPMLLEPILAAGLAMITYAALTYTDTTVFPYFNALLPCFGAALVIYAGMAPIGGLLLRNPVAVGVGLISYSIYLLHWPLIVFWRYYKFAPLSELDKYAVCAITIVWAWLVYRYVETPFRRQHRHGSRWRTSQVAAIGLATAFTLAVPAAFVWTNDGWEWRLPENRRSISNAAWRNFERKTYCQNWDSSKSKELFSCQNYRGAAKDVFVWGDSHALHLVAGISDAYPNYNVYVLYLSGCTPQSGIGGYIRKMNSPDQKEACVERNLQALKFFANYKSSLVILSSARRADPLTIANSTNIILPKLQKAGHKAFVLGDFIRPGKDMRACTNVPAWLFSNSVLSSRCPAKLSGVTSQVSYNARLATLVADFIDPVPFQCSAGHCVFVADGASLFRDSHHLTTDGSIFFIRKMSSALPGASTRQPTVGSGGERRDERGGSQHPAWKPR